MTNEVNGPQNEWIYTIPEDPRCIPDSRGIGYIFMEKLKQNRNKIAQINAESGESQTYEELLKKSILVAQHMKDRGIVRGDIVGLSSYNHNDSVIPIISTLFLGAQLTCLDPNLSSDDTTNLIKLVKPKMIFCVPEGLSLIETALVKTGLKTDIVVFGETFNHVPFSAFLEKLDHGNITEEFSVVNAKNIHDTAFIIFSSGTTGLPKGVCVPQYGILYQTAYIGLIHDFSVSLSYSPPFWISNIIHFITAILYGGCRIVIRYCEENNVMRIVERFKVTYLFLSPTLSCYLASNPEVFNYDTSSLFSSIVGGCKTAQSKLQIIRKNLPHTTICEAYGMTELSGIVSTFIPKLEKDKIFSKSTSCGRPISGVTFKVVDVNTETPVGPYETGELRVKSKSLMNGYFNNPEATKIAYDKDGYIHTGDILYYDDDNCFYIVDRIKEMFKFRGFQIAPTYLEGILQSHPAISEAVVIGITHEFDGYHPMAIVVLVNGAKCTEDDIIAYMDGKVSDREKLRAGVKFVQHLPKTVSGKLQRRYIESMVMLGEI